MYEVFRLHFPTIITRIERENWIRIASGCFAVYAPVITAHVIFPSLLPRFTLPLRQESMICYITLAFIGVNDTIFRRQELAYLFDKNCASDNNWQNNDLLIYSIIESVTSPFMDESAHIYLRSFFQYSSSIL